MKENRAWSSSWKPPPRLTLGRAVEPESMRRGQVLMPASKARGGVYICVRVCVCACVCVIIRDRDV